MLVLCAACGGSKILEGALCENCFLVAWRYTVSLMLGNTVILCNPLDVVNEKEEKLTSYELWANALLKGAIKEQSLGKT